MSIYGGYSVNTIEIAENALQLELNGFDRIVESINVLNENNIILEGIDFSKVKEKALNILTKIKEFFIKIGRAIADFVKKIKNSIVSKTIRTEAKANAEKIKDLDNATKDKINDETDENNVASKINSNTKRVGERIKELLEKLKNKQETQVQESTLLNESGEENIDFSKVTEKDYKKLFYIDLSFNISNPSEIIRYYDESLEGFRKYLDYVKEMNPETKDVGEFSAGSDFSIFARARQPQYFKFDIDLKSSPAKMTSQLFDHRYFLTELANLDNYLNEIDDLLNKVDISKIETIVKEVDSAVSVLNKQVKDNNYTQKVYDSPYSSPTEVLKDFTEYATAAKNGLLKMKKYIDQINISRQILLHAIQMHNANMKILLSTQNK